MRVILGIGNPGKKYTDTRHNVGFIVLEEFAKKFCCSFDKETTNYKFLGSEIDASPFLLIKPKTFVNLSGLAAKEILTRYQISPADLLVIVDDLNLPVGKLRLRKSGGDGGHNGLYSIINSIGSNQFSRIRFGIGNNFSEGEMADYVLSKFTEEEGKLIKPSIETCLNLIENFVTGGIDKSLNFFSSLSNKTSI